MTHDPTTTVANAPTTATSPRFVVELHATGQSLGNLAGVVQLAVALHRDGHFAEAAPIYRQALGAQPEHAGLQHLYGILQHQLGADQIARQHLERAVELEPRNAAFIRDLGETYRSIAEFDLAIDCFRRSLELENEHVDTLCHLGHAHVGQGEPYEAEICYRRALQHAPDDAEIHTWLATTLIAQGKHRRAAWSLKTALDLAPDNDEARFLNAAVTGTDLPTAPRDYVRSLFDRYAASFDDHLQRRLGYDLPRRIRKLLDRLMPSGSFQRVGDLGCGTGLAGNALHDRVEELLGVDLSPKMLEEAQARGIYSDLTVAELSEYLATHRDFDALVAADVLIYVGELEAFADAASSALKDDGLLVFSTEALAGAGRYQLQPSGRFAHSDEYVTDCLQSAGFEIVAREPIVVRLDAGAPIEGSLFAARIKRSA